MSGTGAPVFRFPGDPGAGWTSHGLGFSLPLGPWLTAAAVLLLAATLWFSIRGLHTFLTPWRRAVLITLRAAAVLAVIALIAGPEHVRVRSSTMKSRVAILVDTSGSMSLPSAPGGPPRLERAAAWLSSAERELAELSSRHTVQAFAFGREARAIGLSTLLKGFAALGPPAGGTDILRALEATFEGEAPLSGVVLVTDGADHGAIAGSYDPVAAALDPGMMALLERYGVPVDVYMPVPKEQPPEVRARLVAPSIAFSVGEIEAEAVVSWTGPGEVDLPVVLRDGDEIAGASSVHLGPGRQADRVRFRFAPGSQGTRILSLNVASPAGKGGAASDYAVVEVVRDRTRVLLVAGSPSWDVRFLRGQLKTSPAVDLISFFILRMPDSRLNAPEDELSLIPFPTDEVFSENLGTFDTVILMNFTFKIGHMQGYLPGLARYVEEGGGLIVAGGDRSFSTGEYSNPELASLLPIEPVAGERSLETRMFQPQLAKAGETHPVTAVRADPEDNRAAWKSAPEMGGVNLASLIRPGAVVLLEHPFLKVDDRAMPVVAAWERGRGRVVQIMTDQTWRWWFSGQGGLERTIYRRFYENAIRWASGDRSLKRISVDAVARAGKDGRTVVSGTALGEDYSPMSGGRIHAIITSPGKEPVIADAVAGGDGRFEIKPAGISEGVWAAEISAEDAGGRLVQTRAELLVAPEDPEKRDTAPEAPLMKALASATGGKLRFVPDSGLKTGFPDRSREVVSRRESTPAWDRAWVLLAIAALLLAEWALRRAWGQQ